MKIHKNLAILIAGALAVGTLTGCGSSGTSSSSKDDGKSGSTLTVLTHRTDMDEVFKKYKGF
ncbi:MAG: ABC-type sugar transport system, periplasmic component [Clostridiaceae bacterium]|nr:ABC-type sugar transport system, periplasmic component [Clostridiaceae bacterium]